MLADADAIGFIPSVDLDRALAFYRDVLDQKVVEVSDFGLVLDVGGTKVWVVKVGDELNPQPFTIFGWRVGDLDAVVAGLADRGVEFLRYAGMDQDAAGVWTAPSGRRIVWFSDPDGNNLSLND